MGHSLRILQDIRKQIAPNDDTLAAARARRDAVLTAARGFDGWLRDYVSGSIGHRTANNDTDADCGVVLDRRTYPELGPDGEGEGPSVVVERMREHVRNGIKIIYPNVTTELTKRAITFRFHQPLPGGAKGADPSVDLIVALSRKADEALWIPNRKSDTWDASHPEYHTRVLTAPPADVRQARAHVIRVVKGWNQQTSNATLCSFNVEALALELIGSSLALDEGVVGWFEYAARSVSKGNTKDPAGVSSNIKLPVDRDIAVGRLESAAAHLRRAIEHDSDEDVVLEELAAVFVSLVQKTSGADSKAAVAAALRSGNGNFSRTGGIVGAGAAAAGATRALKTTRSFGDGYVS